MKRKDKGERIIRYITGNSGIPGISYQYEANAVNAPYPYKLGVTTAAQNWRFMQAVRELPHDRIGGIVRYDGYVQTVDEAVVGMRLDTFCQLLAVHYETIRERFEER